MASSLLGQEGGQSPIEQLAKLCRTRAVPATETFDKDSFSPDTVFRGKTVLQWLEALRDADTQGTAKPAKEVWLAMGPRAVPFLVAAQAVFDWEDVEFFYAPRSVCLAMEEKAVEPLVRLLGSKHNFYAWMILGDLIGQFAGRAGNVPRSREQQERIDARLGEVLKTLEPCLGNSDAATRLAALLLMARVAGTTIVNAKVWNAIPVGAGRLLDKDPSNEIRGAACDLLVSIGLLGINGGLSHEDLKKMAQPNGNSPEFDLTLPIEVRRAVADGILMHRMREVQKSPAPAGR